MTKEELQEQLEWTDELRKMGVMAEAQVMESLGMEKSRIVA